LIATLKELLGDSLHDLFSYFLIHNEYKFVELFLDCGIDLDQFLTLSRINVLYDQVRSTTLAFPSLVFTCLCYVKMLRAHSDMAEMFNIEPN